jgi:hypothetical protein
MDPADVAAEAETVLLGEHDVDEAEVEGVIEDYAQCLLSVAAEGHVVSVHAERFLEEEAEVVVVLDQKNPRKESFRSAVFPGCHFPLAVFISSFLI